MTEKNVVGFMGTTDPSMSKEGKVGFTDDKLLELDGLKMPGWFREAVLKQYENSRDTIDINFIKQALDVIENLKQDRLSPTGRWIQVMDVVEEMKTIMSEVKQNPQMWEEKNIKPMFVEKLTQLKQLKNMMIPEINDSQKEVMDEIERNIQDLNDLLGLNVQIEEQVQRQEVEKNNFIPDRTKMQPDNERA